MTAGQYIKPPPEFYAMAGAGELCKQIAKALGKNPETIRYWARHTGVRLADGRPDMTRGAARIRLVALNDGQPLTDPQSKYVAYRNQKKGAHKRGIPWEITFEAWLQVWMDSGKWELRGAGLGRYCMCREGDAGAYRVGNVRIAPFEQNLAERWSNNGGRKYKSAAS